MKKLFIVLLLAFVASASNAQIGYKTAVVTSDSVKGDTVWFAPSFTRISGAISYTGLVGYQFTKADVADSCTTIGLYGSNTNDQSTAIALTGTAVLSATTTDGNTFLYDAAPEYVYYWLRCSAATGDTTAFTNIIYVQKP